MESFVIGRQPILDKKLQLVGYELLYRNGDIETIDCGTATNEIITDVLLERGLSQTVGDQVAFINLTRENLLNPAIEALPTDKVVLEILEDVEIDDQLIDAVRNLSEKGYTIALDDFVYSSAWESLIDLAKIIKLDLRVQSREQNIELIDNLKHRGIKFLAEKVESYEEYREFLELGCDYFQGFFFCQPVNVKGVKLNSNKLATLKLISAINKPDISTNELEELIKHDVGLSVKLLKYINSAFFALPNTIESIKQAIVLLGLNELKKWATLLSLVSLSNKPDTLIRTTLQRARMCELIAENIDKPSSGSYFLTGLLSTLDALMDRPLNELINEMQLAPFVADALIERKGNAGKVLDNVVSFQEWKTDNIELPMTELNDAFLQSIDWERELTALT